MTPSRKTAARVSKAVAHAPLPSVKNPAVDWYFDKHSAWDAELRAMRGLTLQLPLVEELKWGCPCYTLDGKNIVLLHTFKAYCAMLFFKGALLKDPRGLLVQQTKQVQSARQLRFTSLSDVVREQRVVLSYLREAITVEEAGLDVPRKSTAEYEVPPEFQSLLDVRPDVKHAFASLTPGRQRGYLLHFSSAKLSATRQRRVEQSVHHILNGRGLDDSP